jgi:hypothetical protein
VEISPSYRARIPRLLHEKEGNLNLLLHPERPVWLVVNDMGLEMVRLAEEDLILSEIGVFIHCSLDHPGYFPFIFQFDLEVDLTLRCIVIINNSHANRKSFPNILQLIGEPPKAKYVTRSLINHFSYLR